MKLKLLIIAALAMLVTACEPGMSVRKTNTEEYVGKWVSAGPKASPFEIKKKGDGYVRIDKDPNLGIYERSLDVNKQGQLYDSDAFMHLIYELADGEIFLATVANPKWVEAAGEKKKPPQRNGGHYKRAK